MLELITELGQPRVLVVGDLILDRYVHGFVDRISPEGPIPILRFDSSREAPGGAANVACNLKAMGAEVSMAGLLGRDEAGARLRHMLKDMGIKTSLCLTDNRPTSLKTRFLGQGQHLLRLDEEVTHEVTGSRAENWSRRLEKELDKIDMVVFSDYAKGALSRQILRRLFQACRRKKRPVLVDPKGTDFSRYKGATLITPNTRECAAAADMVVETEKDLVKAARKLLAQTGCQKILVTCGPDGMRLVSKTSVKHQPSRARSVYDVSGAGDSTLAAVVMGLASGYSDEDCMHLGNLAGGVSVSRLGASPVSRDDMLSELDDEEEADKLITRRHLMALCQQYREAGKKVVLTTGCFDLVHAGHLSLLREAARQGDVLVVGLNSDSSIKKLGKGPDRPIIDERQRANMLAGFEVVTHVVLFHEKTPQPLISQLKPDVWVKGGDYNTAQKNSDFKKDVAVVKKHGGTVYMAKFIDGHSTTSLVHKIRGS